MENIATPLAQLHIPARFDGSAPKMKIASLVIDLRKNDRIYSEMTPRFPVNGCSFRCWIPLRVDSRSDSSVAK
jgi:hypothetical protein